MRCELTTVRPCVKTYEMAKPKYTYDVILEAGVYVGTCRAFPVLSYVADTADAARDGIIALVSALKRPNEKTP